MRWTAAIALLAAFGGAAPPAQAAGTPAIVAVPGSRETTYATPLVAVQPGDDLRFVNLELFPHDVRSTVTGPDETSWCERWDPSRPEDPVTNPRQFPLGACPLLWTPAISATTGAVETKVYGTENLLAGTTVEFVCTVFPNMSGRVVVL